MQLSHTSKQRGCREGDAATLPRCPQEMLIELHVQIDFERRMLLIYFLDQ